jgi:hypothetical protein
MASGLECVTKCERMRSPIRHNSRKSYVIQYLYNRTCLVRDLWIPKDVDGQFRICNSWIDIDEHTKIILQGNVHGKERLI